MLFLCTGNYYRSRFAEELFNHRARELALKWRADSRALAIEHGVGNVGSISPLALAALVKRGVAPFHAGRAPLACTPADFARAALIIALSDVEHRPLMRERHPEWHGRTEFWAVEDVGLTPAQIALAEIERRIEGLLVRLSGM